MVVFTCQHCGDPVKKPAVEKHYNTKCRFRSPHLTCVDCLKDFSCDDYGDHNQCMTELQRYSALGTVFKEQKGKKKQEEYIEMIHQILNSKDLLLSPLHRNILELCSNYDNVPRKLKPFENFLKNIARHLKLNVKEIHYVFNIIEDAWKKQTKPGNVLAKANKEHENEVVSHQVEAGTTEPLIGKTHDNINGEIARDNTSPLVHNKSKKKRNSVKSLSLDNEDNDIAFDKKTSNNGMEEATNDNSIVKPNKAKKKKQEDKSSVGLDVVDDVNATSLNESSKNENGDICNSQSSKIKTKNHRGKTLCLDNEDDANPEDNDECPESKSLIDSKDVSVDDAKENMNKISKKQLKKKKKYEKYLAELECESQCQISENTVNVDVEDSNDSKKNKKKNKKSRKCEMESDTLTFTDDKNAVSVNDLTIKSDTSKRNKKRKLEESVSPDTPGKKMKEAPEEGEAESAGPAAFNWGDVIVKVLQTRPDKELSLKKLGKKVVNEYQAIKQDHRTYEELLAKFSKKVNKIKSVRVLRDRAKLIE